MVATASKIDDKSCSSTKTRSESATTLKDNDKDGFASSVPLAYTSNPEQLKHLAGMWISAVAVFAARLMLLPVDFTRRPFHRRFLWAAVMVRLAKDA